MSYEKKLKLNFVDGEFVMKTDFERRSIPRTAGLIFQKDRGVFTTRSIVAAARLREYADENAIKHLNSHFVTVNAWTGGVPYPKGLKPEKYQIDAVKFALERNRAYLALDPGLGKTICAVIIMNALAEYQVVYIAPPFLKSNVKFEFDKWNTIKDRELGFIADSMLFKPGTLDTIKAFLKSNGQRQTLLIVDEAHRFKNGDAKRTKALFENIFPLFDRAIFMSGTPLPNRPMELFPVLNAAAPETIGFKSKFQYGMRYCNAHRDQFGYWDFSGFSNLKELSANVMGTFMIRLRKDVLKLPPKIEEMVLIGEDPGAHVAKLNSKILAEFSPEDLMRGKLSGDDAHIATYRRELGVEKAKAAIPYISNLIKDTDEKVILVAIHKDVVQTLAAEFAEYNPAVITGSVPTGDRQALCVRFQTDPNCRIMIFNIQAGGVGFNMTAASRVIFVEFSWVPAENIQASDRAHRYGQTETVLCQYLVFKNSIDRIVLETCFAKERVTKHI